MSPTGRLQLSDEAAVYVRSMIMAGEMRPGEHIRPESVAQALQISTTPAREALQALKVEGFLELVPRKGFIVSELNGEDIRDLFTVQALIAGELAARACSRATDTALNELVALHHEMLAASRRADTEALEEKNHYFHKQVNRMSGSRKIVWALSLMTRYVPRRFYSNIEGWPEATIHDHSDLVDALTARDSNAARQAMADHIAHSGELLAAHFDERQGDRATASRVAG